MHAAIYICQDLWPTHMTELATARRIEGWNRTGYPSGPVRRYATRPLPIVHVSPLRSVFPFSQVETKTAVSGLGTANGSENISVLGMVQRGDSAGDRVIRGANADGFRSSIFAPGTRFARHA